MIDRATRLVIGREIRESARRKGVWALVLVTFAAATGFAFASSLIAEPDDARVMVVGSDVIGVTDALGALVDPAVELSTGDGRATARSAIEDGDVDVAVLLGPEPSLLVDDEGSQAVRVVAGVVANAVATERLGAEGIDAQQVERAFAESTPAIEPIDAQRAGRELAALGITMVLYILTVILTSQVATGVAVEKSNRVSEVLLAIVPPRSLLFGKVIGVGCIGLVTLLAGVTPVAVRIVAGGNLPDGLGRTLVASSVWFVGGLALYLTIAGALGAMVARQEEAGAVVLPLTGFLVAGYVVALSSAESTLGDVLAYVPLVSPMLEPYRIAIGAGSLVEYVLSAVVLFVTVVVAGRVGAVVFRRAIVRTGGRLRLRDLRAHRQA
ncbi:MAG: ABC transporter permease [Ilumatobacteraceae bacterium]